jgi:hypothetical protein
MESENYSTLNDDGDVATIATAATATAAPASPATKKREQKQRAKAKKQEEEKEAKQGQEAHPWTKWNTRCYECGTQIPRREGCPSLMHCAGVGCCDCKWNMKHGTWRFKNEK